MRWITTKYRTDRIEIMDDFTMQGNVLQEALDKIATINQLLGGNKLTLQGVKYLLKEADVPKNITIVDVGCGNGDMLRMIANYGNRHKMSFRLIGVDANSFTINYARQLSEQYPNISYRCEDVFSESFRDLECDIVLCTLTMHHFKDNEIITLLNSFKEMAKMGIVVNDLQRSAVSYRLFQMLSFLLRLNAMSRDDGLISILRGFKKKDLQQYSKQLQPERYTIRWKWAFRYQWIINAK